MSYRIKEIYFTQQGEGKNTGKNFVFVRFSGCNLWSGKEKNRESAICKFCDTDFYGVDGVNGGIYEAKELVRMIKSLWMVDSSPVSAVLTGGEPLLQLDDELIQELKKEDIYIAIETNGTLLAPDGIDWICMSPKAGTEIKLRSGSEIKVVYPQKDLDPDKFSDLDFENFFIQPMDSKELESNVAKSIKFCMDNPKWRLSLQTHKILGIR
jgi:7-carboxy-7-deazaguanine synthase (Cx14CxxC type)|tara:strand:+ start:289 stop:918 length:630 start_codon:yes stop_codon:yes gene_type:complete